jgi:tryptophan synthase beta subunit
MLRAPLLAPDQVLLVNLSGRGDKDLDSVVMAIKERGAG